MKYIANIVTKSKKYKFNDFINVVESLEDADTSVPTIVVGTELAKSCFGDNLNHIVRKIDENMFWTYSVTEKRTANENDIENFKKYIIKNLKKKIDYRFFNVLTIGKCSVVRKMFRIMMKHPDTSIFFTDRMFYISYDNTVIGVSIDECEYLGIRKEKIIRKLQRYFKNITSIEHLSQKLDINFFENNDILLSAMFCYLNK
jgi:hypothetical protein